MFNATSFDAGYYNITTDGYHLWRHKYERGHRAQARRDGAALGGGGRAGHSGLWRH